MIELKASLEKLDLRLEKMQSAVDRAEKRVLMKFGAYVRKRDKSSLRYRKKPSSAGSPPSVHRSEGFTKRKKNRKTGAVSRQPSSPLRELIFFAYDAGTKTVVIGPVMFKGSKAGGGVARTIEEGGTGPGISDGRRIMKRYQAHPHTGPAFQAELPKVASMFKNQIR